MNELKPYLRRLSDRDLAELSKAIYPLERVLFNECLMRKREACRLYWIFREINDEFVRRIRPELERVAG